jgi:hypothetical protein
LKNWLAPAAAPPRSHGEIMAIAEMQMILKDLKTPKFKDLTGNFSNKIELTVINFCEVIRNHFSKTSHLYKFSP